VSITNVLPVTSKMAKLRSNRGSLSVPLVTSGIKNEEIEILHINETNTLQKNL